MWYRDSGYIYGAVMCLPCSQTKYSVLLTKPSVSDITWSWGDARIYWLLRDNTQIEPPFDRDNKGDPHHPLGSHEESIGLFA